MYTMATNDLGNTGLNRKEFRKFCFTLNNYSKEEESTLLTFGKEKCKFFIIGREGDKATPHLQGYMELKDKLRMSSLKKINDRMHIENAKGSRKDNITYCSKEKDFVMSEEPDKELTLFEILDRRLLAKYDNVVWRPWQQKVLDLMKEAPDDRTIHWYWEPEGNVGKTFLFKYMSLKWNGIICDGRKEDVFNQCLTMIGEEKKEPEIIIVNIPRNGYLDYKVLEVLKDQRIVATKYKGGRMSLPDLHLCVFANCEPDYAEMTKGRFKVTCITHL